MPLVFDLTEAAQNLGRVATDVFTTMVDVQLQPCHRQPQNERYTAMLLFRAPVYAALLMECEPKAAAVLTRRMFSLEKIPVGFNDDVRDCLGEMVNMVGGNLRNFLPELEALDATPTVFASAQPAPAGDVAGSVSFETGAGCIRLSLCGAG